MDSKTHPVLRSLTNKGALAPPGAGIALDGMPAGPHEVVELRELDDERVPVVLVERAPLEVALDEGRF